MTRRVHIFVTKHCEKLVVLMMPPGVPEAQCRFACTPRQERPGGAFDDPSHRFSHCNHEEIAAEELSDLNLLLSLMALKWPRHKEEERDVAILEKKWAMT